MTFVVRAVKIEKWMDEEIRKKKLNFSALIRSLLKQYLSGKTENPTAELLKIAEIEEELSKMAETFQKLQKEVDELKKKLQSEKEAKEIEENLDLIRLLEHEYFDDMEHLKQRYNKQDLKYFIEKRLSSFAAEHKISLPEAWQLFFKVFPGMKKELEVD